MKKILTIGILVFAVFIGVWAVKANMPIKPISKPSETSDVTPWWETLNKGETPSPDPAWVLDPEIPDNYIPVINTDEVYMVIENGTIKEYRHRYQLEDGTWVWETIDPNIPENYVAVEGLENVYMVTDEEGNVHYFRYTRNEDDSYFFTEVDEHGNDLVMLPEGEEVPENYVRVRDNIFAEYNEFGVLTGYRERFETETGDYEWEDLGFNLPEVSDPVAPSLDTNVGNQSYNETPSTPVVVEPGQGYQTIQPGTTSTSSTEQKEDGYVETETITMTEETVRDGVECYLISETTITYVYDNNGTLVSTFKDGPYEVNCIPKTAISGDIINP